MTLIGAGDYLLGDLSLVTSLADEVALLDLLLIGE